MAGSAKVTRNKAGLIYLKPLSVGVYCSLQAIWNSTGFPFVMYSSGGLSAFPSYVFEASTPGLCEIWKPLASYVEENALLWRPFLNGGELAPPLPSSLRVMYVERCGLHLWLLNRKGFTPKARLASGRTSTAPSIFPAGDVSGKVWPTRITTQQEGIYPQKLAWICYLHTWKLPCQYIGASR